VVRVDRETNQLTVLADDGRRATYDPRRLSGVSVYREEGRLFATGDRIQFRAPLAERPRLEGAAHLSRAVPGRDVGRAPQ